MGDTNYISAVVKILENPIQTIYNKTIPFTQFQVQLPQIKKNRIIDLVFWGNLAQDVVKYYHINDYIIVEGYLSLQETGLTNLIYQNSKRIKIIVLKVYPFFLSSNH